MTGAEFEKLNQSLNEIVRAGGRSNFPLPELQDESTSWLQKLMQMIADWLNLKPRSWNMPWIREAIIVICWIIGLSIALALILLIAKAIYSQILKQRPEGRLTNLSSESEKLSPPLLELLLKEALKRGAYDEAARIRWKLFLLRMGAQASLTPDEFRSLHRKKAEGSGRSLFVKIYELMFGRSESAQAQFLKVDSDLAQLEGETSAPIS